MRLYQKLVAQFYDRAMQRVERLCLQQWRRELLAELSGDVLEIGAGTGVNLAYYPEQMKSLVLCEPDPAMRRRLEMKIDPWPQYPLSIRACRAERLDAADQSIDQLVATLVFCSVNDPRQALREAFRVLRPGGRLVLIEHVSATHNRTLCFWQHFWQPLWKRFACNCHLTRQTGQILEEAGFKLAVRAETMKGAPSITTPMIVGYAIRPAGD